jgi:hypothetical protein
MSEQVVACEAMVRAARTLELARTRAEVQVFGKREGLRGYAGYVMDPADPNAPYLYITPRVHGEGAKGRALTAALEWAQDRGLAAKEVAY